MENLEKQSSLSPEVVESFRYAFADEIEKDWKLLKKDEDLAIKIAAGEKVANDAALGGAFTRFATKFFKGQVSAGTLEELRKEIFE